MRLIFLVANQAWVFVFGDRAQLIVSMAKADDKRFFTSRDEAVRVAADHGLAVSKTGIVTAMPEE